MHHINFNPHINYSYQLFIYYISHIYIILYNVLKFHYHFILNIQLNELIYMPYFSNIFSLFVFILDKFLIINYKIIPIISLLFP